MILDKALSTAAKEQTGQRDVFSEENIHVIFSIEVKALHQYSKEFSSEAAAEMRNILQYK